MNHSETDNVRVIPDAGGVVIVGADTIAKLSAETSRDRSFAAWDQRIVIRANFNQSALGSIPQVFSGGDDHSVIVYSRHRFGRLNI